jgi:hypothetical protein
VRTVVQSAWLLRRVCGMTLVEWLVVLPIVIALAYVLSRPVSRMPRSYYQDKDQFQWINQLHAPHPSDREEAITALCQILVDAKGKYRPYIVRTILYPLGEAGPQAKAAVPTLEVLLQREEDRDLWDAVRRTLHLIAPDQHPPPGASRRAGLTTGKSEKGDASIFRLPDALRNRCVPFLGDETHQKVLIKAVGWKEHNKLFIHGKEYQL